MMLETLGILLARFAMWPQLAAMRIGLAFWERKNPGVIPPMGPSAFGDLVAVTIGVAFFMVALALRHAVALVVQLFP